MSVKATFRAHETAEFFFIHIDCVDFVSDNQHYCHNQMVTSGL